MFLKRSPTELLVLGEHLFLPFVQTEGIPQQLHTDVQSNVTAKTNAALWKQKEAQRCGCGGGFIMPR